MGFGLRRRLETATARHPLLRRALTIGYIIQSNVSAAKRPHPLDRRYGVSTQAHVPLYLSKTGTSADNHIIPYAGCVPTIVSNVLDDLPDLGTSSFVDLGCGKGRALIVASERPFRRIVGIELNPELATFARRNARRVARDYPQRTAIEILIGDASIPLLPDGDVIVFMYHPFDATLVETLSVHLAAAQATGRAISVIYENPVHGDVFDRHPAFSRVSAAMLPCSEEELPFAFDPFEAVVVWRAPARNPNDIPEEAQRAIVVVKPDYRVIV
ncbi:MAG: hypothetical protein JWL66_988 [Sphingomonadales bacterium]|nr:hypothetical protein [Sphingomonadales bacterium]